MSSRKNVVLELIYLSDYYVYFYYILWTSRSNSLAPNIEALGRRTRSGILAQHSPTWARREPWSTRKSWSRLFLRQ